MSKQKVNCEGYNKETWRLFNRNFNNVQNVQAKKLTVRPAHLSGSVGKVVVPESLKTKLNILMGREGRPVKLSQLKSKYRIAFKSEINPLDYGAVSLTELLAEMSDLFQMNISYGDPVIKLKETIETQQDPLDSRVNKASATAKEKTKAEERYMITRIISPEEIYIQNSECKKAVERLSDRLEEWVRGAEPLVTLLRLEGQDDTQLRPGNFAAFCLAQWVRVSILGVADNQTVSVFLHDFHIVRNNFPITGLYQLPPHLDLDVIPRAVRRVAMAGTVPSSSGWDKAGLRQMKKTVLEWQMESPDNTLIGKLDTESPTKSLTEVWLYDEKGNCLNDVVKKHFLQAGLVPGDRRQERVEVAEEDQRTLLAVDQLRLEDAEDFPASSSSKEEEDNLSEEARGHAEEDDDTITPDDDESSSTADRSESGENIPQDGVRVIRNLIVSTGPLTILMINDALWSYIRELAQIVNKSEEMVMRVIRNLDVSVLENYIFKMEKFPVVLKALQVEKYVYQELRQEIHKKKGRDWSV